MVGWTPWSQAGVVRTVDRCCTGTARDLDFEGIFGDMVSGLLGSGGAAAVHQAPGAPSQVYLLRSMINPDVSNGPSLYLSKESSFIGV